MTPFDDRAFESWTQLVIGGILFGILFELPIILFDFLVEGQVMLTRAAVFLGLGGFVGYVCVGAVIKVQGEASD